MGIIFQRARAETQGNKSEKEKRDGKEASFEGQEDSRHQEEGIGLPKIRTNEELFTKFQDIEFRIKNLKSIVQNDITISESDMEWWRKSVKTSIKELWAWHKEVDKYING
jgi:hypothetical protein